MREVRILAEQRLILIGGQYIDRVRAVMPDFTYKTVSYEGKPWMACPWSLDSVRVIESGTGLVVPSPILDTDYNWPGRERPFAAQRMSAEHIIRYPRCHVHNDLGTGKTRSVLYAYDFLHRQDPSLKMIVVAPLSTLSDTWLRETAIMPEKRVVILHGSKQARLNKLKEDADIYLINHHGVSVLGDALYDRKDIGMVVIDEIAVARNPWSETRDRRANGAKRPTKLWGSLMNLVKGRERVVGLTGNPVPNAPTDVWGQIMLVRPEALEGKTKTMLRAETMFPTASQKWLPKKDAHEVIAPYLKPAIRYERDSCIDMPAITYTERRVEMSKEHKKAFEDFEKTMRAEFTDADGNITKVGTTSVMAKLTKLSQLAAGAVYTTDAHGEEKVAWLDPKQRLEETLQVVRESNSKTIIYCPFKHTISMVQKFLDKKGIASLRMDGDVAPAKRREVFDKFRDADGPTVLVAQPACMSHGLNLQVASSIIWFAPITSSETFEQATARITRPGQRHPMTVITLYSTDMERKLHLAIQGKLALQHFLYDAMRAGG